MKKSIKIVSILMMAMVMIMVATPVFANDTVTPGVIGNKIDTGNTDDIQKIGGQVIGIIRVVGTIVAVAGIILIGIKYIMGSVEEKAEYKKSLIPYFVGCILLFAAVWISTTIYNWANGLG